MAEGSGAAEPAAAMDDDERRDRVVGTLADAFAPLIEADAGAFRRRFRKMATDPFAFYRGSACVFYADVAEGDDRWADDRTSRVWIQGDLHAANFGTYMDADGILVFDVNDFDEAYLGHFTWDLDRLAASLGLLAFSKALSDRTTERLISTVATAYAEQVLAFADDNDERVDHEFRLTLDTTDGILRDVLLQARLGSRSTLLDRLTTVEDHERRFVDQPGVLRLEDDERRAVEDAYGEYLETIPERKRQHSVSYRVKDVVGRRGFGIGSAGLPAYNLLIEGSSQALENDVVLSMKQGNVPAPSRVVTDERLQGAFHHQGHRTAVSQRALQANADPWLGWCELDGTGQVVQELSPYEGDIDWDTAHEPDEILPLLRYLGQATAKVHCVSDSDSEQDVVPFRTETAIAEALDGEVEAFVADVTAFGLAYAEVVRADHRRFVDAFRNGQVPGLEEA